ncbi:hypothetical protein C8Q79DRAFT_23388 [Trametes meyenii]|nr:hypothetical protein C8Q79DRAFT_23388 [Trametes meyenii]
MDIPLAFQALIQNQVDQILQETHQRYWASEWCHKDLHHASPAIRKAHKQVLLVNYPGLLSGYHAADLVDDLWMPVQEFSATIPHTQLAETSHASDLRICNVIWEHAISGAYSVTFLNNHLHATSGFQHFITEGLTSKQYSRWTMGRKGSGFLCAVRSLAPLLNSAMHTDKEQHSETGVALRVGETVAEFGLGAPVSVEGGQPHVMVRQVDLRIPPKQSGSGLGLQFPSKDDTPKNILELSDEGHIKFINDQRTLLRLCKKAAGDAAVEGSVNESRSESLVLPDEVLVTIKGIGSSYALGYLFSGIWGVFPAKNRWSIPGRSRNSKSEITLYLPMEEPTDHEGAEKATSKPHFYHGGFLVPSGISLNRLGISYCGELSISVDGQTVIPNGPAFDAYCKHLSFALDVALRTIPDLAIELAHDVLTDQSDSPHAFVRLVCPESLEGASAYRKAFEAAWRRLYPQLKVGALMPYPYSRTQSPEGDKELIESLGMHPVPVAPHIRTLLEKAGAYPPAITHAQNLLLSAPVASHRPDGIARLRTALNILFPTLEGDFLSVRRYAHPCPSVIWDARARTFVVSASRCTCVEHEAQGRLGPCLCWIVAVLLEAIASWKTKARDSPTISQTSIFCALQRSMVEDFAVSASGGTSTSTSKAPSSEPALGDCAYAGHMDEPQRIADPLPPTRNRRSSLSPPRDTKSVHPTSLSSPEAQSKERPSEHASGTNAEQRPMATSTNPGDPQSHGAETCNSRAQPPDVPSPGDLDMPDLSDIWQNVQSQVNSRIQRLRATQSRETTSMRAQLTREQIRAAELERALAALRTENAEITAALTARDLALDDKDTMLRQRDARIDQLKDSLKALTRRVETAEGEARRSHARERRKTTEFRVGLGEMEKIQQRLSGMLEAKMLGRRDMSTAGESRRGEEIEPELPGSGEGEPVVKRKRI